MDFVGMPQLLGEAVGRFPRRLLREVVCFPHHFPCKSENAEQLTNCTINIPRWTFSHGYSNASMAVVVHLGVFAFGG